MSKSLAGFWRETAGIQNMSKSIRVFGGLCGFLAGDCSNLKYVKVPCGFLAGDRRDPKYVEVHTGFWRVMRVFGGFCFNLSKSLAGFWRVTQNLGQSLILNLTVDFQNGC